MKISQDSLIRFDKEKYSTRDWPFSSPQDNDTMILGLTTRSQFHFQIELKILS